MSAWSYMYTPDKVQHAYITLTEQLEETARKFPESEAFVHRFSGGHRESIKYHELVQKSKSVGQYLIGCGVKPGDMVSIVGPNSINWVIGEYGILFSGGIAVHISTTSRDSSDMKSTFLNTGCKGIFFHPNYNSSITSCIYELLREKTCKFVISIQRDNDYVNVDSIIENNTYSNLLLPTLYPEDPAIIYSTSGSTGKPKLVLHSHFSVGYFLFNDIITEESAIFFNDNPFEWSGGSLFIFHETLAIKRVFSQVKDTTYVKELWKILMEEKCDTAVLLPCIIFDLLKQVDELVPFKLRSIITYGHIIDKKCKSLVERLCQKLCINYSSTECSKGLYIMVDAQMKLETGEVGKPEGGVEVRVVDDNEKLLPIGEIGNIQLRTRFQSLGYYNNEAENRNLTANPQWYRIGDVGYINERQNLVICGRKKDIIVKGTRKIIPMHIEQIIQKCPQIKSVFVVGVPDERFGEDICVCYIPKDANVKQDDIEVFCNRHFLDDMETLDGLGEKPKYFLQFQHFPMFSTGKPDRLSLRVMAKQRLVM